MFGLAPTAVNAQEDMVICTKQITIGSSTQWVITGHVVAVFPTVESATRVYRQQQLGEPDQALTNVHGSACMTHIAGKPVIEPGAKTLHQSWIRCCRFSGLTEDEVHHMLVHSLHHLWRSCRASVTASIPAAVETALLLATSDTDDGDIRLEPLDLLYSFEFYRLYKSNRLSSAVRLEWPSAAVPSILRDQMADK